MTALLSDGPYKEQYRKEMIEWSDEVRAKDYGFFCREAIKNRKQAKICIVSDIRRKTDIKYFNETFPEIIKTIRIHCDDESRLRRDWKWELGVDDVQSECDLDDYEKWDFVIENGDSVDNGREKTVDCLLSEIIDFIKTKI